MNDPAFDEANERDEAEEAEREPEEHDLGLVDYDEVFA